MWKSKELAFFMFVEFPCQIQNSPQHSGDIIERAFHLKSLQLELTNFWVEKKTFYYCCQKQRSEIMIKGLLPWGHSSLLLLYEHTYSCIFLIKSAINMLALYNITIMFLSRTHNFSAVIYTHGTIVLRSTLKFCTHGIWKGTVSTTFTSWCFSKWHLAKCLLSFVLRTLILMRTATSMATHSAVQIPFRYPVGAHPSQ